MFREILDVYLLCFGEFDLDDYNFKDWIVFIMATVLL